VSNAERNALIAQLATGGSGGMTLQAIGNDVRIGLTRERVRQILNDMGVVKTSPYATLKWECPSCGVWIIVQRSVWLKNWQAVMPAHCRTCANKVRAVWCVRGHLRRSEGKSRQCNQCWNDRSRCIIEVRTCIECGKDLEISRGVRSQIKTGRARGEYHRECWGTEHARRRKVNRN